MTTAGKTYEGKDFMKIFIDGDGCPVKQQVIQVAKKYKLHVVIVVDINHRISIEGVEVITVDQGFDSADMAIVNRLEAGDALVTNDIGLASLVIGKGGYVMDANGREISGFNVDRLLFERHLHKEIRMAKGRHKGPKKRANEANAIFTSAFDNMIESYLVKG